MLRNASENEKTITVLVQEKDELKEDVDGVFYKMQLIAQERDSLMQRLLLVSD